MRKGESEVREVAGVYIMEVLIDQGETLASYSKCGGKSLRTFNTLTTAEYSEWG